MTCFGAVPKQGVEKNQAPVRWVKGEMSGKGIEAREKLTVRQATRKNMGELLVESGLLTPDNLAFALEEQKKTGVQLGEALVRLQLVTESQVAQTLATQYGMRYIEPVSMEISSSVLALIPESLARKHVVIPIEMENKRLTVAMVDPLNYQSINDLRFYTGMAVVPAIATRYEILEAISRGYGAEVQSQKWIPDGRGEPAGDNALPPVDLMNAEARSLEKRGKLAPAIQLTDQLFDQAVSLLASDIHIEPGPRDCRVRFRVDGLLREMMRLPKWAQNPLVSRIKILAKLDISERRLPQDGAMRLAVHDREVDFRVSTLPSLHGEKVVIRILDQSKVLIGLDDVGLLGRDAETIRKMIQKKKGMILVTGPTGSGKTTTLYAMINQLKAETMNLTTLEDPVEYTIEGINQVQINSEIGLTFAATLRSILRQDPNVIFVGEIRDLETAEIAFRAAMTGHLVLSTLHTNDAVATITRLVDIGVPRYIVSSAIIGIIAQRLVRKLCPTCRRPVDPTSVSESFHFHPASEEIHFFEGTGCPACNQSGFSGRIGIFEVLTLSTRLRELISSGATDLELRSVAGEITSMEEEGIEKAKRGITTVEEVLRVVEKDEVFKSVCPQCDRFMHADFLVCPYCGCASPTVCVACGKLLQLDWSVCPYCRYTVGQADEQVLKTKGKVRKKLKKKEDLKAT